MIVSQVKGALEKSVGNGRAFSTAIKYKTVHFQKEDISDVLREVPDPQFYLVGNPNAEPYPYEKTPVSESIIPGGASNYFVTPSKPQWQFSKLENGLKIASIDKSGPNMDVGLFVHAGSRFESSNNRGVSHLTQLMAYKSTAHLSYLRIMKTIEGLGAEVDVESNREVIGYTCKGSRNQLPLLLPILTGNVIFPRLLRWELNDVLGRVQVAHDRSKKCNEKTMNDLLHTVAFHNNTLGYCSLAPLNVSHLNNESIKNFLLQRFSPNNMVLTATNVDHDELCKWAMRSFVDYTAIPESKQPVETSRYTGGYCSIPCCDTKDFNLGIAYPFKGMNANEYYTALVLQKLLDSSSITIEGKKNCASKLRNSFENTHVNTCKSFVNGYSDAGLFGVHISCDAKDTVDVIKKTSQLLNTIKSTSEADLKRAKSIVKSSLLNCSETNAKSCNITAKQLLFSNNFVTIEDAASIVDKVSLADIITIGKSTEPAIVVYGNLNYVPHAEEVKKLFKH